MGGGVGASLTPSLFHAHSLLSLQGPRPLLKPAEALAAPHSPPTHLPPAMASALSYVSKFKSFIILFITPLLLLPLIILMPAKVSCVSGQPRRGLRLEPVASTEPGGTKLPGTAPLKSLGLWESGCQMGSALQKIVNGTETPGHTDVGIRRTKRASTSWQAKT